MIAQPVTRPLTPRARSLSDRLHAWADVIAAVGQRLEDPPAVLRLLTEGVRRVMDVPCSILLVTVAPDTLEVKAVSGLAPDSLARLDKHFNRPFVGLRFDLEPGPLTDAYFERRDTFSTDLDQNTTCSLLRQAFDVEALWNLPLSVSPAEACVGMIVLGRASAAPPTDDDRAFAAAFMTQAAVVIKNTQLYESERQQRRREEWLRQLAEAQQQVTASVGASLDLFDVAPRVLSAIAHLIPCDTGSLLMRYGDAMRVSAVHNLPADIIGAEYALAWPLAEQMTATRAPVWLRDVRSDPRVVALPDGDRVRGWLAAPLVVGERIIGQLSLGSRTVGAYGDDEAVLLDPLARQAALALENAQLYGEATRRLQQMATLNEILSAAISTLDFDEVLKRLARALRRTLRYESIALWMAADLTGGPTLRRVEADSESVRWGEGLVGRAAAQAAALLVNNAAPADSAALLSPGEAGLGSQLCVPIRTGDKVVGVIDVRSQRTNAFTEADLHLLSVVAGQLAGALENARLYASERKRAEETLMLLDVSEAISSSFDLAVMLGAAARRTAQVCRVDMCVVLLLDEDEQHFQLAGRALAAEAENALDWIEFNNILQEYDVSDTPRMMETLRGGQPRLVAASEQAGPLWQFFSARTPLNLLMLVPLRLSDRSIGMMILGNYRTGQDFDARQVSLAAAIGRQLAVAVDALRLRAVETERTGYLGILYQVSRSISATLNPDKVLQAAVREIVVRFPYSLASILILDSENNELIQRAAAGSSAHLIPEGCRHTVGVGIIGHVAQTGRTYVTNDSATDPYFVRTYETQAGAELAIPLMREGRVIGVLNLEKPIGNRFSEAEIMAMETLAGQVATALENAQLYARTEQAVREISNGMEQLKQAQMQLIQSAKLAAVGQLAAGVAHEINNPLTTISGFSELLLNDLPPDSPMRNDLSMIRRESQRARDVVRRLLDFARQSAPHREPADVNALLRETVMLMRNAAATKNVNIIELYAPDLPWVRLDENQFKQVALNLLNNAVQAMPRGGTLTVASEFDERETPGVALRIADTGTGIPKENLDRVFEPFFTTKPPGEGTGLGLALSYSIVRDHNGKIEVNSTVGKGTTFVVWFPVA